MYKRQVQNWYPGDKQGRGGIYNFVTKRGICRENARLSWTQVETGSAITCVHDRRAFSRQMPRLFTKL